MAKYLVAYLVLQRVFRIVINGPKITRDILREH